MSKKLMILSGAGGLAAIAVFGLLFTSIFSNGMGPDEKLKVALSLLDDGRWDLAGKLARDLESAVKPEENSTWLYVRGVAGLKSVEDRLQVPNNRRVLKTATRDLTKAQEIGFPSGYLGKGNFYLGWCLFQTYQWNEAVEQLQDSPLLWPEKRSDSLSMVVDALLRKTPPDFTAAQEYIQKWKQIPGMAERELAKIKLGEAQMAYLNLQHAECESRLTEIGQSLPEFYDALIWRGRWRLEAAEHESVDEATKTLWLNESEAIFRQAKLLADTPGDLRRQAIYLSGKCYRAQGKLKEAVGTFSAVRQSEPQSAEAIASGVEEAEILLELDNLDGVRSTLRSVLKNIDDLSVYNEFWVPMAELKRRFLEIGRDVRDLGEFSRAIHMAEDIGLAFSPSDSLRLQAESYQQWAEELKQSSLTSTGATQAKDRLSSEAKFRKAAERFERLSRLELRSSDYTDILWNAIANYQEANDLAKANELLTDYLKFEDRSKRPRGFLAMGENLVNSGKWKSALEPLQRCLIEYPDHPVSYDARLLAAKANRELNNLDQAINLLEENLWGSHMLEPSNLAWRDSLFELGQIVFRQGEMLILDVRLNPNADWTDSKAKLVHSHERFGKAIERLGEAFSRWGIEDDPRHYQTRFLFAKSHRLAAEMPEQIVEANPSLLEPARRKLLQQRREYLEKALQEYRSLHQAINQNSDSLHLQENNLALVRNCYFGEADALFELARWEEAILAYQSVTARFLNQPESLEALMQIAQCYRKLGRKSQASKTMATAKQVLARIPAELDSHFVSVTRSSRDEWTKMIGLMQAWD